MGRITNRRDIQHLRMAGRIAAMACESLMVASMPGVSTLELEALANQILRENRSSAPFKAFEGFNHAICVSLNDEIVNGPPSRERLLQSGDLLSIAIGTEYAGMHGKAARTLCVGADPMPADTSRLLEGTRFVFQKIQENPTGFKTLHSLLQCIADGAEQHQLSVIQASGGNGIGKRLHEDLITPNQPELLAEDIPLEPGMAFTLMPMLSLGASGAWILHEDGWTHKTADDALAAHWAETIFVTKTGPELLTVLH